MKHLKLKSLMVVFGTLFLMSFAFCIENVNAGPVLYFSDMTDGPTTGWEGSSTKGAAVSIWGRNFGSTRGSSTLSVCGLTLNQDSDFAEWGATTNPIIPLGMQRITFWLNSNMQTGAGTIKVITIDGESEEIPFYCRNTGKIYFLDNVNGDDSYNGLYSTDSGEGNGPKRTTGWARGNLEAGDVVYLKDSGTPYNDHDIGTMYHYGSLFSFGEQGGIPNHNNGELNNSITVSSFPGESAKLEAIDTCGAGICLKSCIGMYYSGTQLNYWTFSKFQMNASGGAIYLGFPNGGTKNIRIVNNDATTIYYPQMPNGCIFMLYGGTRGMDKFYLLGNYLHDQMANYRGQIWEEVNEERRAYQVYVGGYGHIKNLEFGWNEMGWGSMGRGLQIYGHLPDDYIENLTVHDNWFHHNRRQAFILGGGDGGEEYEFVRSADIYNNIMSDSGWPVNENWVLFVIGGISWGRYGGDFRIYNNIMDGRSVPFPTLQLTAHIDSLDFMNNIVLAQPNAWNYITYYPDTEDTFINNVIIKSNHNLWFGAGDNQKPSWDSSILDNVDPQFINSDPQTYDDFRLLQTSPAVDTGTSDVSSIITHDFNGNQRPMDGDENGTAEYDIGAYEVGDSSGDDANDDTNDDNDGDDTNDDDGDDSGGGNCFISTYTFKNSFFESAEKIFKDILQQRGK